MNNDMNKAKDFILDYIRASGPVSFDTCLSQLQAYYNEKADAVDLSNILTELIRARSVELYDDGKTFILSQ